MTENKEKKATKESKTLLKWVMGWILTVTFVVVLFYKIPFADTWKTAKSADPLILLAAAAISLFGNLFGAIEKFRRLVEAFGGSMRFRETFKLKMGLIPLDSIMPMKSGKLFLALYLKKEKGMALYLGGLILLTSVGLSYSSLFLLSLPGWLILHGGLITITGTAVLFFSDSSLFGKLATQIENIKKGFFFAGWKLRLIKLGSVSLLFETCKVLMSYAVLTSVGIEIGPGTALTVLPVSVLASMLPLTALGIGLRESSLLLLLAGQGNEAEILAAGFLISFIDRVLPLLIGIIFVRDAVRTIIPQNKANENPAR